MTEESKSVRQPLQLWLAVNAVGNAQIWLITTARHATEDEARELLAGKVAKPLEYDLHKIKAPGKGEVVNVRGEGESDSP